MNNEIIISQILGQINFDELINYDKQSFDTCDLVKDMWSIHLKNGNIEVVDGDIFFKTKNSKFGIAFNMILNIKRQNHTLLLKTKLGSVKIKLH